MNRIKFSHFWDKLYEPEFTTIRPWKADKERYYRNLVSEEFQIWKAGESYPFRPEYVICHAYLLDVKAINPNELDTTAIEKDVLLNGTVQQDWIKRILKYNMALLLTFSKEDPSLPFQVETQKFFEILSGYHRKEPGQRTLEDMEVMK